MTTFAVPRSKPRDVPLRMTSLTVAGIAGPVLFLIGQSLFPVLPDAIDKAFPLILAHREQLMAARLLTGAGAFLLAIAAVHYARLVPTGRGAVVMRVGATLFGVASFSNALSQVVSGYAAWTVTSPGFDGGAASYVVANIESGVVALPLGFWSIPAFALGALLMAVGLRRSKVASAWVAPLLVIGTLLAGALAGLGPVVGLTQLPFTIALVAMAVLAGNRDGA